MPERESVMKRYAAFDGLVEGAQVIDREWRYAYVNATVAAQGKSTRESLLGRRMMEMYPGIEGTEMFSLLRDCMETRAVHQLINEFDFPDGTQGYFELRLQPVPEGVLILSFDVTRQKLAEKLLQRANAVLEEKVRQRTADLVAKNRELEQFVYIASHDLQEPLRTISNYLEVLEEDFGPSLADRAREYLQFVGQAAGRMKTLIRALLEFSRLGRDQLPVRVDCARLIREVLEDLQAAIQSSGASVQAAELPELEGFETGLRQVFQNLISNAVKFSRKGVTPEVRVDCAPMDGGWEFSVRDNGIGIDPAYQDRIFRIFQRLHKNGEYEGTGIGLAHCRKIVEMHGGEISVESIAGEGSVFRFTLPKSLLTASQRVGETRMGETHG